MKDASIYGLKLHETVTIKITHNKWTVTRVASGWLYQNDSPSILTPVGYFVPYSNEFQV